MALGTFDDQKMCDGWLERMDLFVEDVAAQLGISVPTAKIPVSLLQYDMTTEYCKDDNVGGCYLRDEATGSPHVAVAIDSLTAVYHELVHFIVIEWGEADGHAFYDEGMAESLAEDGSDAAVLATPPTLQEVLDDPGTVDNRLYLNIFFKHLFAAYGLPTVLEWGRSLHRDESEAKLLEEFERVFRTSLEAEWNTDWFVPDNMYAVSAQCLSPATENPTVPWHYRFTNTCDEEMMSYIDLVTMQRFARVEIEEAGDYLVFATGFGNVWITSCSVSEESTAAVGPKRHFEAGVYVVNASFWDMETDAEVEVSIIPFKLCDPFADTCPDDEKCFVPTSDQPACYPQTGTLKPEGAACEYPDFQGTDNCEKGFKCVFGFCRPACTGTVLDPQCPEDHTCFFENPVQPFTGYALGLPGLCVKNCDPLNSDCPEEQHCLWSPLTDGFVCGNQTDESMGKAGDTGCVLTSCQEGLYCSISEEDDDLGVCVPVPEEDNVPFPKIVEIGTCPNRTLKKCSPPPWATASA